MNDEAQKYNHNDEEKIEVTNRICEIYQSQRVTLASACEAAGINERTFRVWRAANTDIAGLWKNAKSAQTEIYWQDVLKPLAETAFEKLLKGQTVYLKHTEGREVVRVAEDGKVEKEFIVTRQTVTEKHYQPHPSVVIFAMKLINPEMVQALGEDQMSGTITDGAGGKIQFTLVGPDRSDDDGVPQD
jgi:hypothetical protein